MPPPPTPYLTTGSGSRSLGLSGTTGLGLWPFECQGRPYGGGHGVRTGWTGSAGLADSWVWPWQVTVTTPNLRSPTRKHWAGPGSGLLQRFFLQAQHVSCALGALSGGERRSWIKGQREGKWTQALCRGSNKVAAPSQPTIPACSQNLCTWRTRSPLESSWVQSGVSTKMPGS